MTVLVDIVTIEDSVHINIDGKTWFRGQINEIDPSFLIDFALAINEKTETQFIKLQG